MGFELTVETAPSWVTERGLAPRNTPLVAAELAGGVSASVIAVTGAGIALVLKQALPRLRVPGIWEAKVGRTELEVAALQLLGNLTPGVVPAVLAHDPENHVVAMELLPVDARNWQAEIGDGRVHSDLGSWAGRTLGIWHMCTSACPELTSQLDDFELFEQLRLAPFYETLMSRRPDLASLVEPYVVELRSVRRCLVDGDYAPKNMLIAPDGRSWVLDFEVAHVGNPVFDLGFFLSFVLLSALRWPALIADLRTLADRFLAEYAAATTDGFAGDAAAITGHTACLVLARTDGTSPAVFLDDWSRECARKVGIGLLEKPERGLWSWC